MTSNPTLFYFRILRLSRRTAAGAKNREGQRCSARRAPQSCPSMSVLNRQFVNPSTAKVRWRLPKGSRKYLSDLQSNRRHVPYLAFISALRPIQEKPNRTFSQLEEAVQSCHIMSSLNRQLIFHRQQTFAGPALPYVYYYIIIYIIYYIIIINGN